MLESMKARILAATFSLTGVSLAIGALGFLSGFVQLFVDVSLQLSVKWLLLMAWLSLTLLLILLKIVYDLHTEARPAPPFEVPIRYLPDQQVFVIRRNDNFLNSIVVGCYIRNDEVDTLACIGVVHNVQEKVIQIRLHGRFIGRAVAPASPKSLARLVIRPVIPIDALNQLTSTSNEDD